MVPIIPGRMTHEHDGELVVFLIGMRVNRPWRPDLWLPVVAAMPRMLTELSRDPGSGLLGHRVLVGAGGPTVVQYWSSLDKLYAYASQPDADHSRWVSPAEIAGVIRFLAGDGSTPTSGAAVPVYGRA